MGRTRDESARRWLGRGLWLLLLALVGAWGVQAIGLAQEAARASESLEAPLPQPPLPIGPSPEEGGAEEPDRRPGREDPEEFYKPPPRPQRRLTELPA